MLPALAPVAFAIFSLRHPRSKLLSLYLESVVFAGFSSAPLLEIVPLGSINAPSFLFFFSTLFSLPDSHLHIYSRSYLCKASVLQASFSFFRLFFFRIRVLSCTTTLPIAARGVQNTCTMSGMKRSSQPFICLKEFLCSLPLLLSSSGRYRICSNLAGCF